MGSAPAHHLGTIIMKFLLLIAAIASVRAEADPAFTYATGYHLPYAYGAPLTYAAAADPLVTYAYTAAAGCQNEAGAVVPCAHGGVVPFGVVPAAAAAAEEPAVEEARKKREAEAEPEADPEADPEAWYFYRTHGYWPHGYGHLAYSYAPYAYAGHYGYYGRKKREATAEADADASPEADPWLLYGAY